MSNEITGLLRVNVNNGGYVDLFNQPIAITQTTLGANSGVQTIGTTAEALSVGDVASLGVVCLQNLDATNFITYGMDDAGTMKATGKLKPGESAVLRLVPSITLKLLADTAACKLRYLLLAD